MSINTLLTDFYQILNEFNNQYWIDNEIALFDDLHPLEEATRSLSDEDGVWDYAMSPLKIIIPYIPSHTIPAQNSIKVILKADTIIQSVSAEITNPVLNLNFDIQLRGNGSNKAN
jgi:hypothetical protein